MAKDGSSDIAEVLEKIRARLRPQVEAELRAGEQAGESSESRSLGVAALRQQLGAILSAHRQVGTVNPRHPGLINSLIQLLKRFMRRSLAWYIRPNVEFQSHVIKFLTETAETFEREQSRLGLLEKKIEGLAADVADLRQLVKSHFDWEACEQDKPKREEK
jgi:hypothetical protein